MWIGLFLICVGILLILGNMDYLQGDAWDYIWPLFFIMLGASMILKRTRHSENRPEPPRGPLPPNSPQ